MPDVSTPPSTPTQSSPNLHPIKKQSWLCVRFVRLIKNFNQDGITLKTDTDADTEAPQQDLGNKSVSKMAKRATRKRQ